MNTHRHDIVVVDDDPDVRLIVCRVLQRAFPGLSVGQEPGGLAARERLCGQHPRLVIVDVNMPGLDGPGLCEYIRTEPQLAHTRVLALTGFASERAREDMFDHGASEFLTKPVLPSELVSSVGRMLS